MTGGPSNQPLAEEAPAIHDAAMELDEEVDRPLKPLTDIAWPPEPDASIFGDPLKKDDPKPLRREELMRIGKSTRPCLQRANG